MQTHYPLNELYIYFPVDHGGSSVDNFSNAGIVVPVSTFGNYLVTHYFVGIRTPIQSLS